MQFKRFHFYSTLRDDFHIQFAEAVIIIFLIHDKTDFAGCSGGFVNDTVLCGFDQFQFACRNRFAVKHKLNRRSKNVDSFRINRTPYAATDFVTGQQAMNFLFFLINGQRFEGRNNNPFFPQIQSLPCKFGNGKCTGMIILFAVHIHGFHNNGIIAEGKIFQNNLIFKIFHRTTEAGFGKCMENFSIGVFYRNRNCRNGKFFIERCCNAEFFPVGGIISGIEVRQSTLIFVNGGTLRKQYIPEHRTFVIINIVIALQMRKKQTCLAGELRHHVQLE